MSKLLFSGSIIITIQGERVLTLQKRHHNYAEYTLAEFDDQIVIYDYRDSGLKAIDHVLTTNNTSYFPNKFNGTAHLTMFDLTDNEPMIIELRDSFQATTHLLWIAVGLDKQVPIYEYDVGLVQQMDDCHIALLALLDIAANNLYSSRYGFSSKSSTISKSTLLPFACSTS
jgi:hypothetical protein